MSSGHGQTGRATEITQIRHGPEITRDIHGGKHQERGKIAHITEVPMKKHTHTTGQTTVGVTALGRRELVK